MKTQSKPLQTYSVYNQILGLKFEDEIVKLGSFTLYKSGSKLLLDIMNPINDKVRNQLGKFDGFLSNTDVVHVDVKAKDFEKAKEIAQTYLKSFDYVLSFILNISDNSYSFGVYTSKSRSVNNTVIISGKAFHSNSEVTSMARDVVLSSSKCKELSSLTRVWGLITKENKTEIEKRLLMAIEWIGKAIFESDPLKSFVMYMFSIESLLQYNEKNQMINPSISYQLSESLAFILSDDYQERITIMKDVKDLYGKRSAIAHGGHSSVDENDIFKINAIAVSAVWAFLNNQEMTGFKSMKEFQDWLLIKKFSGQTKTTE